jgi:hypothetical protein
MSDRPTSEEPPPPRRLMDAHAYERRSRRGPCFVCEMLAGNPDYPGDIVWADDEAVAFLARYNTLLGHTLVAPRAHREQVTADFRIERAAAVRRLLLGPWRARPPRGRDGNPGQTHRHPGAGAAACRPLRRMSGPPHRA